MQVQSTSQSVIDAFAFITDMSIAHWLQRKSNIKVKRKQKYTMDKSEMYRDSRLILYPPIKR